MRENNARCNPKNLIEQLKNGLAATRMPVREFDANWAYLVIGALASPDRRSDPRNLSPPG